MLELIEMKSRLYSLTKNIHAIDMPKDKRKEETIAARNKFMAKKLKHIIRERKPKKILIITGARHAEELGHLISEFAKVHIEIHPFTRRF